MSKPVARTTGHAKYAADGDLHSKEMTAYLDELGRHHIAVDPTLVVLENTLVPDTGTIPPADAPYADTLPPQLVRGLLQSALAPEAALDARPAARVTPHPAWASGRVLGRSVELFVDNLRRFAVGEPLLNVVDPTAGY